MRHKNAAAHKFVQLVGNVVKKRRVRQIGVMNPRQFGNPVGDIAAWINERLVGINNLAAQNFYRGNFNRPATVTGPSIRFYVHEHVRVIKHYTIIAYVSLGKGTIRYNIKMNEPKNSKALATGSGIGWPEWVAYLEPHKNLNHAAMAKLVLEKINQAGASKSPEWWAQGVTIAYEQHIGRRQPGQTCDVTSA